MKKIENPGNDKYVYISLHGSGDVPFERTLEKVNRFMAEAFPEADGPVYTSASQREMIYQLKRPDEEEGMREFFQSLSSLFIAMASYLPHFTHYHGGGDNGNG